MFFLSRKVSKLKFFIPKNDPKSPYLLFFVNPKGKLRLKIVTKVEIKSKNWYQREIKSKNCYQREVKSKNCYQGEIKGKNCYQGEIK